MSFCDLFTGGKGKRPSAVSPDDVTYKMIPLFPLKKDNGKEHMHHSIKEHIFENPDENSPVAAVSCKLDDGKIQVELYSRAGAYDEMIERMTSSEVPCCNKDEDVHPSTLGSPTNGVPVHDKSVRLIGFEENISLRKPNTADKASDAPNTVLAECFDNLANAPLLSSDPAMREAVVRKIYQTLPVLEAAVKRATPGTRAKG